MIKKINPAMLADFYELTMANGYLEAGIGDKICYFDLFFRTIPDQGGFVIAAGLEQVVEFIENLHFTDEDIEYLRSKNIFTERFLEYLRNFKFTGDIYAVPEGTVVFPGEPLLTVRAKAIEAQFIETFLLLCINHQSLIATKANRIVRSADGRTILEMGARRAHGADASVYGARAAYIGGVIGTSQTAADQLFSVPVVGTMGHSWIQMFPSEYDAFKAYAKVYPHNAVFLVDTYNVLKSGVPNAIKVVKEVLWPKGIKKCGIRIDSGDLEYLAGQARKMLDEAGLVDCRIIVSNSLDEYIIKELVHHDAKIDSFGVGERLITAKSDPVFGGVYKLVAIEEDGKIIPKIKISENSNKVTTPHFKKVYRLYCKKTNKALADLITVYDEEIDETQPLEIFDPVHTWKRKTLVDYYAINLLKPIFKDGKRVYDLPTLEEIRAYCQSQLDTLWDELKRFEFPHKYYVDLSLKLWEIKDQLIKDQAEKYLKG
ncbi:MAG: nicotinate phosphoribosyltransferase [Acholeplasmataceae bacterium]|nr:nicotinate phosphoribosyltransferase [Acholeplasmataceae bacterium]